MKKQQAVSRLTFAFALLLAAALADASGAVAASDAEPDYLVLNPDKE